MSDSDTQPSAAPGNGVPRKNLWQRWMAWSGSFLVLSILAHVILLGGATILVVQVVQGRKEKLKFTAPPPSSAGPAEHKVKPSKKTAAAAPAISKRITSTAANASIALPAMDMNTSSGPDVMASVMSGLGSSGLGGGAGGAGAGGLASMPLAGLTAFGFKGTNAGGGLKGQIYDLKQTADHKPTEITDNGYLLPGGKWAETTLNQTHLFSQFFNSSVGNSSASEWDEKLLERFYRARDSVVAYQVMIPYMPSTQGPKSFGVEKEVPKASHWTVLYKGKVIAPRDGTFRFLGRADDMIAVRFNGQNVFIHTLQLMERGVEDSFNGPPLTRKDNIGVPYGRWFSVQAGKSYPMEIAIAEMPGGQFTAQLYIEEKYPATPYPHRTFPGSEKFFAYPVFAMKKGIPLPERKVETTPPPNASPNWRPTENYQEVAPDPVIFPGK